MAAVSMCPAEVFAHCATLSARLLAPHLQPLPVLSALKKPADRPVPTPGPEGWRMPKHRHFSHSPGDRRRPKRPPPYPCSSLYLQLRSWVKRFGAAKSSWSVSAFPDILEPAPLEGRIGIDSHADRGCCGDR